MASHSRHPSRSLFRFADLVVSSTEDLPELESVGELTDATGVLALSIQESAAVADAEATPAATSLGGGGHYTLSRAGPAFLCRFAGLADFLLKPGNRVELRPAAGTCVDGVRHLLLDHVLPRLLAHDGRLVVHAAAVRLEHGSVAFVGPSGMGKSTLSASFLADGHPVESDDALVLSLAQRGRVMALPTYRTLRLWPASVAGLYADPPELAPQARGSEKRRLVLPKGDRSASPLSALFVLAPCDRDQPGDVSLRRLSAHEACMTLIENAFQLDASDPRSAGMLFEAAAAVATRVSMYRLAYPRSFATLPAVRAAVMQQLGVDARRPRDAAG